jgi:hypothetical protein
LSALAPTAPASITRVEAQRSVACSCNVSQATISRLGVLGAASRRSAAGGQRRAGFAPSQRFCCAHPNRCSPPQCELR